MVLNDDKSPELTKKRAATKRRQRPLWPNKATMEIVSTPNIDNSMGERKSGRPRHRTGEASNRGVDKLAAAIQLMKTEYPQALQLLKNRRPTLNEVPQLRKPRVRKLQKV